MNILFIGDITGPAAVALVAERVPELRATYALDLVIANADNVAISGPSPMGGSGLSCHAVELLLHHGVDLLTSGTHAWDGAEAAAALAHPRVLRAHNVSADLPGRGVLHLEVAGQPVTVLVLADTPLLPNAAPIYAAWQTAPIQGTAIVHVVGEAHKVRVFAHAVDGAAAAVLGTLTHEASLYSYLLPGGTALVPDVGMVGALGGIGGFAAEHFVALLRGEDCAQLPPYRLLEHPMIFDAVRLGVLNGRTVALQRLAAGTASTTQKEAAQ